MNMKRFALACVLCMLAGTVHGTFELEDPDGKIYDELMGDQDEKELPAAKTTEPLQDWEGKGAGHMSCAQYLSYMQQASTSYSLGLSWVQGFVNGADYRQQSPENFRQEPDYNLVSVAIWLQNYCDKNQADSLSQAAEAFVADNRNTK